MAQNRYGKGRKYVAAEDIIDHEDDEVISNIPQQVLSSLSRSLTTSNNKSKFTREQKRYRKPCSKYYAYTESDYSNDMISRYGEAFCEGWYVFLKPCSKYECFLWNPSSRQKLSLPSLEKHATFFHERDLFCSKCVLSSPPSVGGCTVLFTNGHDRSIIYCKVVRGQRQWVLQTYDCVDKYKQIIAFKRKVYAINIAGDMVEIVLGARQLQFEDCDIPMPLLYIHEYRFVESCGDLFFVMMLSNSYLAVFKVDFSLKKLVRIYDLGDRIFVVSQCYSTSFNGVEWGLRGNHVYHTMDSFQTLYSLNLQHATMSITENRPECSNIWIQHDGLMPIPRRSDYPTEKEENHSAEKNKDAAYERLNVSDNNYWFELPRCIQQLIAESYMSHGGRDYMNFRLVCKSWKAIARPFYWRSSSKRSSRRIAYPWLMYVENNGTCNFHDPKENVTYSMRNDELSDCVIRFSKHGWLLLSKGARSVFLYEPFAKTKIKLPELPMDYCFCSVGFSTPPSSNSSTCCTIVGIAFMSEEWVCIGYLDAYNDTAWNVVTFENDSFGPALTNPVFLNGAFYILDLGRRLGVFELNDQKETSWRVLINNANPYEGVLVQYFLVRFKKQLYSVLVGGRAGELVKVYWLKLPSNEWVLLRSLKKKIFFISQTTSLAVVPHEEKMKNKVYTSNLTNVDNHHIFYSLDTKKYHTFDGGFNSTIGLYGTTEYLQSSWIQPRLVPAFRKAARAPKKSSTVLTTY